METSARTAAVPGARNLFRKNPLALCAGILLLVSVSLQAAEDRKERVLNDRKEVEAAGRWIYNDLPKGFAEAARTRKPLLVVIRCIP